MKCFRAITLLMAILFMIGCGGQESGPRTADKNLNETAGDGGDEAVIRAILTEYIERMVEGDKTVLYENEFLYYTDIISLTEYYEYPRVRDYPYDSLSHVIVDSVEVLDDSAYAWIRLFYLSDDPEPKPHEYKTKLYRSMGRWYRPYMSHWEQQLEYDEEIRAYQQAVEREQAEQEGK